MKHKNNILMRFQKKINWKQLYTLFNPNSAYFEWVSG